MSSLGQCGDCQCEKVDMCKDYKSRTTKLDEKLKVLKDYSCLISSTTCVQLPKRIGQYSYFLWCYLQDLTIMSHTMEKRIDNLCSVVRCQDKKLEAIMNHLIGNLADSVDFTMADTGSTGAEGVSNTYTKMETDNKGNFTISWNMVLLGAEIGKGSIKGKVNHTYEQNEDGSIKVSVKGFTLTKGSYKSNGSPVTDHNASFTVYDKDKKPIYRRAYDPQQSWSEDINKDVKFEVTKDVPPKGGTTGDIHILSTLDDWTNNDTNGTIAIKYTNNHSGLILPTEPCNIKCSSCENAEGRNSNESSSTQNS